MEIILKTNKKREGFSSLFGIKGLSIDKNLITLKEAKKLDNFYISLNKNMFNKDLPYLEEVLIELEKTKVKGVFFYDLAVLSITKRLGLNLNLIWAGDFLTTNYKTCNFYYKEGVKGVLISNVLTCDEICEISNNTKLESYVNIFGKQLIAISKRRLISNYFEYINEDEENIPHNMIEKGKSYRVIEESYGTKIYSDYVLNGIVYLKKLNDAGVKSIILDDIDVEEKIFDKVLDIFKKALTFNYDFKELEEEINKLISTERGFFNKKTIYKVKKK